MGKMVDGVWHTTQEVANAPTGSFDRAPSRFRARIGDARFPAEPGRYHLYVSLACPWAHRTLILRRLKGLTGIIGLSVTHWLMGEQGWTFEPGEGVIADPGGARALHEVYRRADPAYSGSVTVPALWDKFAQTIVSNESSEIIRMFNSAFNSVGAGADGLAGDVYPEALRSEIDAVNARIYEDVNNGVYRAGFAKTQSAHDEAVEALFTTLDWAEARLRNAPTLVGGVVTEADWRLFTTLVRFDPVYHGHFKCNRGRLADYPALHAYARRLAATPGVRETIDYGHIKRHYYLSHPWLDPTGIVPDGPDAAYLV